MSAEARPLPSERRVLSVTLREALILMTVLAIALWICTKWTVYEQRMTFGVVSLDTPWRRLPTRSEAAIRSICASVAISATWSVLRVAARKLRRQTEPHATSAVAPPIPHVAGGSGRP
ncbi:MAG: hypothetical protein ABUL64_04435 [Singulisphaera sp.]